MSHTQAISPSEPTKLTTRMKALLAIFTADPALMEFVGNAVDFQNDLVDWDRIFASSLSPEQHGSCLWAFGLWTGEPRNETNVFEVGLSLDANLRTAVLKAIRIRWGLVR